MERCLACEAVVSRQDHVECASSATLFRVYVILELAS